MEQQQDNAKPLPEAQYIHIEKKIYRALYQYKMINEKTLAPLIHKDMNTRTKKQKHQILRGINIPQNRK